MNSANKISPHSEELAHHPYTCIILEIDELSDRDVFENLEKFCKKARVAQKCFAKQWARKEKPSTWNHQNKLLYRPQRFLSLEENQKSIIFLLADRSDFVNEITSHINFSIADTTFSFCPNLANFPLASDESDFLQTPAQIIELNNELVQLTKIQLTPLANIGAGLLLQKAIYLAIMERFTNIISDFENHDAYKLCILDSQDWAEISVIITGKSPNDLTSIIADFSEITIQEIIDISKQFGKEEQGLILQSFKDNDISPIEHFTKLSGSEKTIYNNHVIDVTYSTLSISTDYRELLIREVGTCNEDPTIFARVKFSCYEGHDIALHKQIEDFNKTLKNKGARIMFEQIPQNDSKILLTNGRFDIIYDIISTQNRDFHFSINLPELVVAHKEIELLFCNEKNKRTRHIIEADLELTFAIPQKYKNVLAHPMMSGILSQISKNLFEGAQSPISLSKLERSLRKLSLDVTLNYNILSFFDDYRRSIEQSQSFSGSLDLLDFFIATHKFLESRADNISQKQEKECFKFLQNSNFLASNEATRFIAWLGSLEELMRQRLRNSPQRKGHQIISLGAKSGFSQLLSSSDAILKCATGVIRRYMFNGDNAELGRCSMVAALSSNPRPRVSMFAPENDNGGYDFVGSSVSMSYTHLVESSSLIGYIHEAAHLLYQIIESRKPDKDQLWDEPLQEIFCEQVVLLWIFEKDNTMLDFDVELYTKNCLARFLVDPISDADNSVKKFEILSRFIIRLFYTVVFLQFRGDDRHIDDIFKEWVSDLLDKELKTYIIDDRKFIQKYIENLTSGFRKISKRYQIAISIRWEELIKITQEYLYDKEQKENKFDNDAEERVSAYIHECLNIGMPISPISIRLRVGLEGSRSVDRFYLVRKILYQLISNIYGENGLCDTQSFIVRDDEGLTSIDKSVKHSEKGLALDRRRCGVFVLNPESSRKLMLMRISVTKTLWDVSCGLRGRRANYIQKLMEKSNT